MKKRVNRNYRGKSHILGYEGGAAALIPQNVDFTTPISYEQKKTLVLGVGNLLLTDDGVGIHTIQRLVESGRLPEGVQVEDGGTCGLDLLQFLDGVEHLVVVDAAKFGKAPGTILRMENEQVPAYLSLKTSPHEIGLPELMLTAQLTGIYPPRVVVFGVQPDSLETGIGLTPAVAEAVDQLVELVVQEVS